MGKPILFAALMFALPAMAASQQHPTTPPAIDGSYATCKVSHDQNYLFVKCPKALVFDREQQESMQKLDGFVTNQLSKLPKVADPDGDLKALTDSIQVFEQQVDQLVQASGQVYNEVKHTGMFKADPTGIILFAGTEFSGNLIRGVTGGGSAMVGVVRVPMDVHKYRLDTRQYVGSETEWDSSWVLIPTVNVGPGVTATGGGKNLRAGIGLIWGPLNSASEVVGYTFGPSVTAELWKGVNVKLLALDNPAKTGAINNTILMIGFETASGAFASNFSIFGYQAEAHFNASGILPLSWASAPLTGFLGLPGGPAVVTK